MAERDEQQRLFMKNLAHELAGPLTPVAGYLRILESGKLGALDDRQRKVIASMSHSLARLTRIVENLSDFATLDVGEARLRQAELDPGRLAEEVVEEQGGAIRDGRLHVSVRRSGASPVVADGPKLGQALSNLLENAVKFSPHGGEVLIEVEVEAGWLRYSVYDQGPGVAATDAETIFEPLRHAGRRGADEARAPGSGLGLPVARRIAEAHGGTVRVESPPGRQPDGAAHGFGGSRFVLEIPARPAGRPATGP